MRGHLIGISPQSRRSVRFVGTILGAGYPIHVSGAHRRRTDEKVREWSRLVTSDSYFFFGIFTTLNFKYGNEILTKLVMIGFTSRNHFLPKTSVFQHPIPLGAFTVSPFSVSPFESVAHGIPVPQPCIPASRSA